MIGIWLRDRSRFDKDQPDLRCWHLRDKRFRFGEGLPQAIQHCGRIDGGIAGNASEIRVGIAGDPSNFVNDAFRCEAGRFARRRPDRSAERQNSVMDCQQIDNVARFPAPVSGGDFIGCKIDRV